MTYYSDMNKWKEDYPEEAEILSELQEVSDEVWENKLLALGWISITDDGKYQVTPDDANPIWHIHVKNVDEEIGKLVELGLVEPHGVNPDGSIVYRRK